MFKYAHIFVMFIVFSSFLACTENTKVEEITIDYGYDYFPLQKGKYIDYRMDSVVYDFVNNNFTAIESSYYTREMLTDTFTDNEGRLSFKIERFERQSQNEPWQVKNVWYATKSKGQAERVEDNYRFVKLAFPVRRGLAWQGASYINEEEIVTIAGETLQMFKGWSSEIITIDTNKIVQIGSLSFNNVLTVRHADDENAIEKRFVSEKYAKGVGMVYREAHILDTQCGLACDGETWEEKAEKGFILKQTIIGYN